MKKILILVLLVITINYQSSAQITYISQSKIETILKLRGGTVRLCKDNTNTYYIVLPTSNRFDDPFLFYLGKSKDESINTIDELIKLMDNMEKDEIISIINGNNKITLKKYVVIGVSALNLIADKYAGVIALTKNEALKIYNKLIEINNSLISGKKEYKVYDYEKAISITQEKNITLIGYTKKDRLKVYFDPDISQYLLEDMFIRKYGYETIEKLSELE